MWVTAPDPLAGRRPPRVVGAITCLSSSQDKAIPALEAHAKLQAIGSDPKPAALVKKVSRDFGIRVRKYLAFSNKVVNTVGVYLAYDDPIMQAVRTRFHTKVRGVCEYGDCFELAKKPQCYLPLFVCKEGSSLAVSGSLCFSDPC